MGRELIIHLYILIGSSIIYYFFSKFQKHIVIQYFKNNPDFDNPTYNTKNGIYSEGCGLENVMVSWGHDDYMYLVCIKYFLPQFSVENNKIHVK